MDKKTAIHIAAETIVLGSLTTYLINRIGALENRILELEKDLQATARHTVSTEKKQTEVLNAMGQLLKSGARPGSIPTSHQPSSHNHNHGVKHTVQPISSSVKKKVSFSDADDEDEDEDSSSEEEVAPIVRAKISKTKTAARSKGVKVSTTNAPNPNSRKDMASVREEAAKLAPPEDE